jgi:hypothetical protein
VNITAAADGSPQRIEAELSHAQAVVDVREMYAERRRGHLRLVS